MRIGNAAMVLALAVGTAVAANPPLRRGPADRPPFPCDAVLWQTDFEFAAARFHQPTGQIYWELQARHEVEAERFEALLTDGDGVQQGVVPIVFQPAQPKYEKGAILRAVLRIPPALFKRELGRLKVCKTSQATSGGAPVR